MFFNKLVYFTTNVSYSTPTWLWNARLSPQLDFYFHGGRVEAGASQGRGWAPLLLLQHPHSPCRLLVSGVGRPHCWA